jgi:hypothetical protein
MKRLDNVIVLVGNAMRRGWRMNANIKDGEPVVIGRDSVVGCIRLARDAPVATTARGRQAHAKSGEHRLRGTLIRTNRGYATGSDKRGIVIRVIGCREVGARKQLADSDGVVRVGEKSVWDRRRRLWRCIIIRIYPAEDVGNDINIGADVAK